MADEAHASALLDDIVALNEDLEKQRTKPVSLAGHRPLTKASLHLLDVVGAHPVERLGDIARRMDVTKGAVSQQASRLEAAGLLDKLPGQGSARDIYLVLTPEGQQIYRVSDGIRRQVRAEMLEAFSRLRADEVDNLRAMLRRVNALLASCEPDPAAQPTDN